MGHMGLGIGVAHARVLATVLPTVPVLVSAPTVTGSGVEGATLTSDTSDIWAYGAGSATVTMREYRLMIDGLSVAGDVTETVVLPQGSGGLSYSWEIRVTVADGGGARSAWTPIATGLVADALVLSQTADGEIEIDAAAGNVTVKVAAPPLYANADVGHGAGIFVFDSDDLVSGPINLAPPRIIDDGTPADGETLTVAPGLWAYDPDHGGLGAPTYQWQADTRGDGAFSQIGGATSESHTLTSGESGDNVQVQEILSDNAGLRTATSASIRVETGGPTILLTDSFDAGDGYALGDPVTSSVNWEDGVAGNGPAFEINPLGTCRISSTAGNGLGTLAYAPAISEDHAIEVGFNSYGLSPGTNRLVLNARRTDGDNLITMLHRPAENRLVLRERFGGTGVQEHIVDPFTLKNGDKLRIEVKGTTVVFKHDPGVGSFTILHSFTGVAVSGGKPNFGATQTHNGGYQDVNVDYVQVEEL